MPFVIRIFLMSDDKAGKKIPAIIRSKLKNKVQLNQIGLLLFEFVDDKLDNFYSFRK